MVNNSEDNFEKAVIKVLLKGIPTRLFCGFTYKNV